MEDALPGPHGKLRMYYLGPSSTDLDRIKKCWNGQLAGNGLITYFLPVMMQNAGVTSRHTQLV